MALRIVELLMDEQGRVLERTSHPTPHATKQAAEEWIQMLVAASPQGGQNVENDFYWTRDAEGHHWRYFIEGVAD